MTWSDWKWQLQNRITTLKDLEEKLTLTPEERASFTPALEEFSFAVTPYYLERIDKENPNCPIRKQILPRAGELTKKPNEVEDPLAEERYMPVKGVTHRYPDRAIWYISHVCAVYCRFCTRKRKVSDPEETPNRNEWEKALDYFRSHTELREIILSGGDPLTLSDSSIDYLLGELKSIPHINQVRIHSRHPVTMPMRLTQDLASIFAKYFPLYMVTHFNHPNEITEETKTYVMRLIKEGHVSVFNQSVLLSGINDDEKILSELNYKLISIGIKPYYLHQCDEVFGSSDFVVPIERGIEIYRKLRGFHSGITIPNYVKDLTGGGGKVLLSPNYLQKKTKDGYLFQNYLGDEYEVGH
ncbi:putative EF-P beta-lysylation protein EpmB [Leptospira wolbachii serovar Codice str. CDC]|uniref:EF-P beta-lysylation protein EpmB n=1 Tax=Leptospira wolbachii serovar Codice str. CDC TaxID=1218599 RepID=R8ZYL3_9LEPT|nr:KamA family radical SAM protein [Leptospira wolbachii]EOQ94942.1 putative EF-P beta-lysylation protein EpmB [Leptospira wolbachii serovar Codice str. CDC]